MTQPAMVLSALDVERSELEERGVSLDAPADLTQPQRDAWASDLLRVLGEEERDLARFEEARAAEHRRIDMRYDIAAGPTTRRIAALRAAVCRIALEADFGKRKSRDVGFGTYGRKHVPVRVTVTDETAALDWAQTNAPSIVKLAIDVTADWIAARWESLPEDLRHLFAGAKPRLSKSLLNAHVKTTGEDIPGVVIEPAHDEPFAKVAEEAPGA